jgi:hypothetical protein
MKKECSEYIMSITGKCNVPKPFKEDITYVVASYVEVDNITKKNNHDGTYSLHYKLKQTGEAIVQNENGEKIKVDSRSQSRLLRQQIFRQNREYDSTMTKIRHYLPTLLEYMDKLDKE